MAIDLYHVTPARIQEARAEFERCEAAWRSYGFKEVDQDELAAADAVRKKWQWRHKAIKGKRDRAREEGQGLYRSIRSLRRRIADCERSTNASACVMASVAGGGMSLLLAACCGLSTKPPLGVLIGFILLCITVPTPVIWFYLRRDKAKEALPAFHEDLAQAEKEMSEAETELEEAQGELADIDQKWDAASAAYRRLADLDALRKGYWAARNYYEEVQRAAQSEQWRLLHTDWRSLRGIGFENFLQRVFESLGYKVETTKASGDQGIDLILTAPGRRIGIQAKGYADNIGNSAVQEAFTGKAYYGCDSCAVITNSDFTTSAREAAFRVGCTLVSGSQIPELIAGNVRL